MKQLKKAVIACLLAVMMCAMPVTTPFAVIDTVQAATVGLNQTSVTLYVGDTVSLTVKGAEGDVVWTSQDPKTARVSEDGLVRGLKKGSTVIEALYDGKTYECNVSIKNPVISQKSASIEIGNSLELSLKGATGNIVWYSSDKSVATVDTDGFVIAKTEGKAIIVAKYYGKKYRCTVIVEDKDLHVSVDKLTVYDETVITITSDDDSIDEVLSVEVEDPTLLSYELSDWVGYNMYLSITPLEIGTTTLTITSNMNDDVVTVEVNCSELITEDEDEMSAKEVYKYCNDSVVEVETDNSIGTGFFVEGNLIVTNYHVIDGAAEIKVTTYDEIEHDILYIMGYDEELDIAILAIDDTYEPLEINQHEIEVGESVYTIGSSLGLTDTFSNGMVTNISRYLDEVEYVQTNAAISKGNSGSPLLNEYGEVLGIITLYYDGGQNLNFAISIEQIYQVAVANPMTLDEFYNSTHTPGSGISFIDPDAEIIYEDSENSNSIDTCQTIDTDQYIYGAVSGEPIDYYKFVLEEDTNFIEFYGFPLSGEYEENNNLYFVILDEEGYAIAYAVGTYDEGTFYQYAYGLIDAGTYYIAAYTMDDITEDIEYGFYITDSSL